MIIGSLLNGPRMHTDLYSPKYGSPAVKMAFRKVGILSRTGYILTSALLEKVSWYSFKKKL